MPSLLRLPAALVLAVLLAAPASAQCTLSWVSPTSGAWTDAVNWDLNRVPIPTDEVCITVPGTYAVTAGPVNVRRLTLGGTSGTQTLTVNTFAGIDLALPSAVEARGVFVWQDGTLTGALTNRGTLRLTPTGGGGLRIAGPASVLRNEGTLDWPSGDLTLFDRARLENAALLSVAGGRLFPSNTAGPQRVVNEASGTIRKTGPDPFQIVSGLAFDNRGALDVQGGTFAVDAAATFTDTPLAVAAGASLLFRAGTQTFVGTLSGTPAGEVILSTTWQTTAAGLTLALGGTGMQWTDSRLAGGRVVNTGRLRMPAPGASRYIDGAGTVLRNEGTVEWAGDLTLFDRARVENAATWVAGSTRLLPSNTAGPLAFVNEAQGTIRKTGADALTVVGGIAFETGGTLDVQGGTVAVDTPTRYLDGARLVVAAGATLHLRTGRQTFAGTFSGAPAGTLLVSAPVVASPRAVWAFSGTGIAWADNGLDGGRLVNRGTVRFAPPVNGTLRVDGATSVFRNEGTVEWPSGDVTLFNSGQFQNAGTLSLTGPGRLFSSNTPGPFVLVNEAGATIRKAGAETFTLNGVRLRNQAGATLALDAGTLVSFNAVVEHETGATLTGAGRLAAATVLLDGTLSPGLAGQLGTLTLDGPFQPAPGAVLRAEVGAGGTSDVLAVTGPVALGGTLLVSVRPGYTPQVGDAFTVVTGATPTGLFASVVTAGAPAGVRFNAQPVAGGVRVTAVAGTGGAVAAFPDSLVAGDRRTVLLLGPLAGATAARLVCTSCLDAAAFGTIPAQALTATPDGLEARFDLSDPRVLGQYDVVVDLPGGVQSRAPLPVRPFLSAILFDAEGPFGIAVVPAPEYRWSQLRATTVSNSAEPAYPLVRVEMPAQPYVRVQLNSSFHGYGAPLYDRPTAADAAEALVLLRVAPSVGAPLNVGSGIAPERVRFPGEPLPADTTTQIAFGAPARFALGGTSNLSLGAAARALAEALRTSASAALTAYAAQVDAASPSAVAAAARGTLDAAGTLALNPAEVLADVLGRTSSAVPAPPGLAGAAAGAFQAAFRAQAEARDRAAAQALAAALAAGGPTGALVQREIARLRPAAPTPRSRSAALTASARRGSSVPPETAGRQGFFDFFFGCNNSILNNDQRIGGLLDQMQTGQANGAAPVSGCVTAPFDPNDKTTQSDLACEIGTVVVGGNPVRRCVRYSVPLARRTDEIAYTVEFENDPIATAPAERVVVTDVLDDDLDPATVRILGTSSDSTFTYTVSGQTVTFYFTGIDLPPNRNAPEGQGFVSFAVRPRAARPDGTQILNSAAIVFDFNPPILTPAVEHLVRQVADPAVALALPAQIATGVPFMATLTVANAGPDAAPSSALALALPPGWSATAATADQGSCQTGADVTCTFGEIAADGTRTVTATLVPGPVGPATLTATATSSVVDARFFDSAFRADVIVQTTIAGEDGAAITELTLAPAAPNPFRGSARVRFGLPAAGAVEVAAFDLLGRRVAILADAPMEAGWHEVSWDADGLAPGVYLLRLRAGSEARTVRVVHVP